MANAKSGTIISHIALINSEVDSTWITNHYNGLQRNIGSVDTLLTEAGLIIETEDSVSLELNESMTGIEITTIPFTGDENPSPNSTSGQFKSS